MGGWWSVTQHSLVFRTCHHLLFLHFISSVYHFTQQACHQRTELYRSHLSQTHTQKHNHMPRWTHTNSYHRHLSLNLHTHTQTHTHKSRPLSRSRLIHPQWWQPCRMMKAWIQSTSLYLQINGWPPNQLQPDWPTPHSLKPSQRHSSKLHAEYYIRLMIPPRSPRHTSVRLQPRLQVLHRTPYFCWKGDLFWEKKAKHIKGQYFRRSRRWILTSCNVTLIPNRQESAVKYPKPGKTLSLVVTEFLSYIKMLRPPRPRHLCRSTLRKTRMSKSVTSDYVGNFSCRPLVTYPGNVSVSSCENTEGTCLENSHSQQVHVLKMFLTSKWMKKRCHAGRRPRWGRLTWKDGKENLRIIQGPTFPVIFHWSCLIFLKFCFSKLSYTKEIIIIIFRRGGWAGGRVLQHSSTGPGCCDTISMAPEDPGVIMNQNQTPVFSSTPNPALTERHHLYLPVSFTKLQWLYSFICGLPGRASLILLKKTN